MDFSKAYVFISHELSLLNYDMDKGSPRLLQDHLIIGNKGLK